MLAGTTLRNPVLINTVGHAAGLLLFGFIVALLIRDRRSHGIRRTKLSILAAALAFAWNAGSLLALGFNDPSSAPLSILMNANFSVLSLVPAVLLHLALKGRQPGIARWGYAVSAGAAALHISEFFAPRAAPHQLGLILIAAGFGVLTLLAALRMGGASAQTNGKTEWFSLACLFLFTSSFLHFGYQHVASPWAAEITWHHIGIPVALVVLVQDYRFLLLDTFIRFLMNSVLAAGYVGLLFVLGERFQLTRLISGSGFRIGLALVSLCLSLILFAHLRNSLQRWVGRVVFRRQNLDRRIRGISRLASTVRSEDDLLSSAALEMAAHLRTDRFAVVKGSGISEEPSIPAVLFAGARRSLLSAEYPWAEVQIPLRFSNGEVRFLVAGPRRGSQRYLSEDLEDMRRLAAAIVEQIERFRSEELRRLAARAELRALQAQINPHFFFNALNTLYGTIDRGSQVARRMVLNLADIFRYFMQGEAAFIPLSDELRIVRAYLEIESLRLGDRLETIIDVSEAAQTVILPALLIQPLVENAVKHGIAMLPGRGRVSLRAGCSNGKLRVTVEDTGPGFAQSSNEPAEGCGIGLDNVRRRLQLSYGPEATLDIHSSASGSSVTFLIPAVPAAPAAIDAA